MEVPKKSKWDFDFRFPHDWRRETITLVQFRALFAECGKRSWSELLAKGRSGIKTDGIQTALGTARWVERGDRKDCASKGPWERHGHGEYLGNTWQ